ncbi:hypothetical protein BGW80DRAFT_1340705 [Lactifluus volemus]|nr:hypothetical protein BGW80DRAFT_1340705 [Lactifluus volemus]
MHTNQDGASRRGFPSMSMFFFSRWCCLQKCTGPKKKTVTLSKFVPGCTAAFLEQTPLIVERHRVVSPNVKRWHRSPPRVEQILSRVAFKHLCTMSIATSEVPKGSFDQNPQGARRADYIPTSCPLIQCRGGRIVYYSWVSLASKGYDTSIKTST